MFPPTNSQTNVPAEQLTPHKSILGKLGLCVSFMANKYLHEQALSAPGRDQCIDQGHKTFQC